ncbi:hypothetical protein RB195_004088 [Necator americanus]|uniref:Uncharacterized protein n=1 Tax=Necator americanus TaxID=51031 RepID=A0ABR1BJU6_NECAM
MIFVEEDDALRMRWALVCSVPDPSTVDYLSKFSSWFLTEVTKVAGKLNIYARFEDRPKVAMHVPVGDFEACAVAYERIRRNWPAVMFVLHILPEKNASEYEWMRSLSAAHGFVRQGVLLENALDKFASVAQQGDELFSVFSNVAQWVSRATSKLCLDKDPVNRPYDLRVGSGVAIPGNVKIDQDAVQTAVNTVLCGSQRMLPLHREESAVLVSGFPSSLNEFGVAQLFPGMKVTGVTIAQDKATVTFATKFLAYQACELDSKKLDRYHTLHVQALSDEVQEQLELNAK